MQHFPREKAVLALVILSLILFAFMLLVNTNIIANVSAVEARGVGVYWDSGCSETVFSIDWGALTPGSVKNIVVYIRNEVEESTYLTISTMSWNPLKASDHVTLRWDHSGQRMNPDEIIEVTLTLSVSRYIEEISSFSFHILITGSDSLPGDINGDGIIGITDVVIAAIAFGSKPGDPNWNPLADLNQDGTIKIQDLVIIRDNFGKGE
jgi:hypothetical protein